MIWMIWMAQNDFLQKWPREKVQNDSPVKDPEGAWPSASESRRVFKTSSTWDDKNIRKLISAQSDWAVSRDIAVICRHQAIFGSPGDRHWRPVRDDTIWVFWTDLVIELPERSSTRRTSGRCRKTIYASMICVSLWSCTHINIHYMYLYIYIYNCT